MKGFTIAEMGHVINALPPVDIGGVIKVSDYFSLKNYQHASIIVQVGVTGNAPVITLYESNNNAGGVETAIGFDYYLEDTAAGDTLAVKATATSGGVNMGANDSIFLIIEIDAAALTNGKPYLAVKTNNAAAALVSVVAVLSGARYGADTTVSAIT